MLFTVFLSVGQLKPDSGAVKPENRYPLQTFLEDSGHVFWTSYPNPFSPPTITETTMGMVYSGFSFYCDLSDTVTVGLLGERDSILYAADMISVGSPHFMLAYCFAGSRFPVDQLPHRYFRSGSGRQYKVLLSVRGRPKCIRAYGIYVPKDWYCWLPNPSEDK
jgi:hypothetical protein